MPDLILVKAEGILELLKDALDPQSEAVLRNDSVIFYRRAELYSTLGKGAFAKNFFHSFCLSAQALDITSNLILTIHNYPSSYGVNSRFL